MKIIAPPAITDLDGIIDLLIHPEKYVKYLQDLKTMKDAIVESLGVLETKEKAEDALGRASQLEGEAATLKREAQGLVAQARQQAASLVASATAKCDAERAQLQRALDASRANEQALAKREAGIAEQERALMTREQVVAGKEAAHRQAVQTLQAEQDRLVKMKAALAELN